MASDSQWGRDARQCAELSSIEHSDSNLDAIEISDGWMEVYRTLVINAGDRTTSNGSILPGWQASTFLETEPRRAPLLDPLNTGSPNQDDFLAPPNHGELVCSLASSYDSIMELRDHECLARAKADNLWHKHEASCSFIKSDLEEISAGLEKTLQDGPTTNRIRGLINQFMDDHKRYQRQLSAARVATTELNEIGQQIYRNELNLHDQVQRLSTGPELCWPADNSTQLQGPMNTEHSSSSQP